MDDVLTPVSAADTGVLVSPPSKCKLVMVEVFSLLKWSMLAACTIGPVMSSVSCFADITP
jgi:hypothetical protein